MTPFADLHGTRRPLILPNAWDFASAATLVRAGFDAIGTTSLGVAVAAGLPDGAGVARDETLAVVRRLAGLPCLLSVDLEGGFSDDPAEVASLVRELGDLGAVGVNLEDGRADSTLRELDHQCAILRAVKDAAPEVFLNARTDTFWAGASGLEETLTRVRAFRDAGADGVFVPGIADADDIRAVVAATDLPLNVLHAPGVRTVSEFAELGVRRVSTGSYLFRVALDAAVATAEALAAGHPTAPATHYSEYAALASGRA